MSAGKKVFMVDFGVIARFPDREHFDLLSMQVIQRAKQAIRGYPEAKLKQETLKLVWQKEGDKHLRGRVEIDWGFGASRPPDGPVTREGTPIRGE